MRLRGIAGALIALAFVGGCSTQAPAGPPTELRYEVFGDGPARFVGYMQGGIGYGDDGQKVDVELPHVMTVRPGRAGTYSVSGQLPANHSLLRADTRTVGCRILDQDGNVLDERAGKTQVICTVSL